MSSLLGVFLGLFAAASWGLGSILLRPIMDPASEGGAYPRPRPDAVNFFKNGLACIAFLLLWAVVGGTVESSRSLWGLLASGALGFALGDSLFFAAISCCGVQTTAVVSQLNVPISVLMCWIWLDEALSAGKLTSIAVILVGVWLVIVSSGGSQSAASEQEMTPEALQRRRRGILMSLGCAMLFASSIVIGHAFFADADLVAGSLARLLGGLSAGVLLSALADIRRNLRGEKGPSRFGRKHVSALLLPFRNRQLARALLPGAMCASVLCLLPFGYSLKVLDGGVTSVLGSTTPIFTLLFAFAAGDRPKGLAVIGTLIVFLGVAGLGLTAATG